MADRSAATLFAAIFEMLARDEPLEREVLAQHFWAMSRHYDFRPYQMYCDESLIKLGLARRGVDPRSPDDGEVMLYGPGWGTPPP